jgi:hypothetical protein
MNTMVVIITHLGTNMARQIQRQVNQYEISYLFSVEPSVLCCNINSQVYTA